MCQKQKEMDIDFFSAYQMYPIIYFMLSLFQLILLDSAIKQKFHFGLKKKPQFIVHDKGFIKY